MIIFQNITNHMSFLRAVHAINSIRPIHNGPRNIKPVVRNVYSVRKTYAIIKSPKINRQYSSGTAVRTIIKPKTIMTGIKNHKLTPSTHMTPLFFKIDNNFKRLITVGCCYCKHKLLNSQFKKLQTCSQDNCCFCENKYNVCEKVYGREQIEKAKNEKAVSIALYVMFFFFFMMFVCSGFSRYQS